MTVVKVLLSETRRSILNYTLINRTDRNLLNYGVQLRWFTVARRRDRFAISSMTIKNLYRKQKLYLG